MWFEYLFKTTYNTIIFNFVDDSWMMTTRIVGSKTESMNSSSFASRRIKDRKKDKDRERFQETEREKIIGTTYQKQKNLDQNMQYRVFDSDPSHEDYHHNTSFKAERNLDRNIETSNVKHPKSILMNKPFAWPYHSNKEINNYFNNQSEPKYYLGTYLF